MAATQGELLILSEDKSTRAQAALRDTARKCREAAAALKAVGLPGTSRITVQYIAIANRCEASEVGIVQHFAEWKGGR